MVLVAQIVVGSFDPAAIARWADVPVLFVDRVTARLHAQGVWQGAHEFAVDWLDAELDDGACAVALLCDALVGLGTFCRTSDRRYFIAPAAGRAGAAQRR